MVGFPHRPVGLRSFLERYTVVDHWPDFVGANRPVQANETATGRAANRRIELVIYPETF